VKDVNTVFYIICSQEVSVNELICVVWRQWRIDNEVKTGKIVEGLLLDVE